MVGFMGEINRLPEGICLVCGLQMAKAYVYDGEGVQLKPPPDWHSPKFLGARGQACKKCESLFDEKDAHRVLLFFEIHLEAMMAKENPAAHAVCLDVKARSHPDIEGESPSVKARLDRAELKMKGQVEFHTWRQATWAWHVISHEIDEGWPLSFGWIAEGYRFPEVTRPRDQRFIDLSLLPRYPDGSPYSGPEDPRQHKEWITKHGAYRTRPLEEPRLL
jgi:hypothetical protein